MDAAIPAVLIVFACVAMVLLSRPRRAGDEAASPVVLMALALSGLLVVGLGWRQASQALPGGAAPSRDRTITVYDAGPWSSVCLAVWLSDESSNTIRWRLTKSDCREEYDPAFNPLVDEWKERPPEEDYRQTYGIVIGGDAEPSSEEEGFERREVEMSLQEDGLSEDWTEDVFIKTVTLEPWEVEVEGTYTDSQPFVVEDGSRVFEQFPTVGGTGLSDRPWNSQTMRPGESESSVDFNAEPSPYLTFYAHSRTHTLDDRVESVFPDGEFDDNGVYWFADGNRELGRPSVALTDISVEAQEEWSLLFAGVLLGVGTSLLVVVLERLVDLMGRVDPVGRIRGRGRRSG